MTGQSRNIHQENAALRKENTDLRSTVKEILAGLSEVRGELSELRQKNKEVVQQNEALHQENLQLREEIRVLKTPKNSGNSSLPPSSDLVPRTRSLRESQGKKPGGQPGHEGSTLKMSAIADQVADHLPERCGSCGEDLSLLPAEPGECRQQIDLPVVRAVITRHQVYSKVCSCGNSTRGSFPPQVRASLGYGPGIEALVAYLSVRQYLPYGRIAELLQDSCGLTLSCGTIAGMLQRFSRKGAASYQTIREALSGSTLVGADETGAKVNGRNQWMHTWQNRANTFIACHAGRGSKAITEHFPQGFPKATLVSDCLAGQLATPAAAHQLCIAHLLRELNYFKEAFPSEWVNQVSSLLSEALKADRTQGETTAILELRSRLQELLSQEQYEAPAKVQAFWIRLVKHQESVLHFLDDPEIPPDNNGSERAIRNIKVKQKVSGQFKSDWGANAFALIRSIIDTAVKRKENVIDTLKGIANNYPALSTAEG